MTIKRAVHVFVHISPNNCKQTDSRLIAVSIVTIILASCNLTGLRRSSSDQSIDAGSVVMIVCGKRLRNGRVSVRPSVRLSRLSIASKQQRRAARLPQQGSGRQISTDSCRACPSSYCGQRQCSDSRRIDVDLLDYTTRGLL